MIKFLPLPPGVGGGYTQIQPARKQRTRRWLFERRQGRERKAMQATHPTKTSKMNGGSSERAHVGHSCVETKASPIATARGKTQNNNKRRDLDRKEAGVLAARGLGHGGKENALEKSAATARTSARSVSNGATYLSTAQQTHCLYFKGTEATALLNSAQQPVQSVGGNKEPPNLLHSSCGHIEQRPRRRLPSPACSSSQQSLSREQTTTPPPTPAKSRQPITDTPRHVDAPKRPCPRHKKTRRDGGCLCVDALHLH